MPPTNLKVLIFGSTRLCVVALLFVAAIGEAAVKVGAINDLVFGTWSGSGDLTAEDEICVYNSASSNYEITITAPGGAYQMNSGGNFLPYEVYFKQNGGSYTQLNYGVAAPFGGANTSSNNCGGMTNATIRVKLPAADLASVRPGSYGGSLTILVAPS